MSTIIVNLFFRFSFLRQLSTSHKSINAISHAMDNVFFRWFSAVFP
jgi:hypothetical protein